MKNLKIILRKYVLNPLYVLAGYSLFLCTLYYENPFKNFPRPSLFILMALFLFLRFLDDTFDYEKDLLNDKAVVGKGALVTATVIFAVQIVLFSVFSADYLFVLLPVFCFIIYAFRLKFLKPLIVPSALALTVYYDFNFHPVNLLVLIIIQVLGIVFANLKKRSKEEYTLSQIGGKAYNLYKLNIKNTPEYFPIKTEYLNPPDEEKLKLIVKSFCKKNKLYAVRSSAVDEDSESNSFAGVHDTFLNVKKDDVLEKILEVVKSAQGEKALKYRKDNKLSTKDIKIAVLLQEMVDADYAGVLNTINPVTNNFSQTVISVTKGLGDKLVDGSVDGTMYYLEGKKKEVRGEDILCDKILNKLVKLADELRAKTERFQDCEFAVKNNRVYFLQSRAITTYDVNTRGMTLLIDNSNLIESYYGLTSPLTHSFAHEIYTKVYTQTCLLGKFSKKTMEALKPSLQNMLYSYEGKLYYNLNSWYRLTSLFPSKNSASYMESMMGVKASNKDYKKVKLGLLGMLKIGIILIHKLKNIDKLSDIFIEHFNQIVNPYYGKSLEGLKNEELRALYEAIDKKIVKEFTTPILNDIGVMIYFGRLKEKSRKYKNGDEILCEAVNNNGNVESAKSATEFVKITEYIKKDEKLKSEIEKKRVEELTKKYFEEENELSKMIRDYIQGYGPRVMNELKLETVTMIEEPSMIFTLLKDALKNPYQAAEIKTRVEIPPELKKLSLKAKHFIQNREKLRLRRTYIFSVIRNLFLAYGKNFQAQGLIDSYRDIFYLTKDEIFYGLKNNAGGKQEAGRTFAASASKQTYRDIISFRKKEDEINAKKPYYSRIAFFGDKVLPVSFINSKGLTGIPSGKGVIKEKVCVMETKDSTFIPGSIIVTKRTDPGWISLFPLAGGLIVEHGSMLSHSFVVAREMNLPCVVGVEGITQKLKTGDLVTLDALKGEITIES